jgi:hypothetical protein
MTYASGVVGVGEVAAVTPVIGKMRPYARCLDVFKEEAEKAGHVQRRIASGLLP